MKSRADLRSNARWHKKNRKAGLCTCGRELVPGRTRCKACLLGNRESSRKYQARMRVGARALGFCTRCIIRVAMPGRANCGVCAEYNVERNRLARAAKTESNPKGAEA